MLLVADMFNHKMRRAEVATGAVTTLAGSGEKGEAHGVGDAVQFHFPHSLAISPDGSAPLSVTESINDKIRRVEVATGAVTTLAGCGACGSVDGLLQAAQTTSQRPYLADQKLAQPPPGSGALRRRHRLRSRCRKSCKPRRRTARWAWCRRGSAGMGWLTRRACVAIRVAGRS